MKIYRIEDVVGKGFYSSSMFDNRATHGHFHGEKHPGTYSDLVDDTFSLRDFMVLKHGKGISIFDWYYGFNSYAQMKEWFMPTEQAWADLKRENNFVIVTYKVHKAHTIVAKAQTVFRKDKATKIDAIPVKMMEYLHD